MARYITSPKIGAVFDTRKMKRFCKKEGVRLLRRSDPNNFIIQPWHLGMTIVEVLNEFDENYVMPL